MRLLEIYALQGPNIFCHLPVIGMVVDLQKMKGRNTSQLGEFNNRLLSFLPGLKDHHCCRGKDGGLLERLQEGTLLGHVMEHVALELQVLLGYNVYFGQTRSTDHYFSIVFEYKCEPVGIWAGRKAFQLIKRLLRGHIPCREKILEEGRKIRLASDHGPSTMMIMEAAGKNNIPVFSLIDGFSLVQLGYGCKRRLINAAITENTSCVSVDIACDKWQTRLFLQQHGFPFSPGFIVNNLRAAYKAVEDIGFPVVTKPYNLNQGKGVTLKIRDKEELKEAFYLARAYSPRVIIEKNVPGKDYRLLIIGQEMVAAAERVPAFVVGDGTRTIEELIELVNSDPKRGYGHEKPLTRIYVDGVVELMLRRQGYDLKSCPDSGEKVFLRGNGNLSTGGTSLDVTDQVHEENIKMAIQATRLIGLDVAGVDLVTPDISLPLKEAGGVLIEINASPGLRMHHFPTRGKARDVANVLVKYLFPEGDGRIPIVSVTGTNGKTTVCRIIAHLLNISGFKVGLATTDGLFYNGERILKGDCAGPRSARNILTNPLVEAAVLETARGGIIKEGLGYDRADVAVITNISRDHLDRQFKDLDDLWWVKSLVAERITREGLVVINADDPYLADVVDRVKGKKILCSKNEGNIRLQEHLQAGGQGVLIRDGTIIHKQGLQEKQIIRVDSIPLTWGGQAAHQVDNVLTALACALALGLPYDEMGQGISSFAAEMNTGRLQLMEGNRYKVILDYGHNLKGFVATVEAIRGLPHSRLLGVIGMPGDRTEKDFHEVGRFFARATFSHIYIKEDENRRGRLAGEVARFICRGLEEGNYQGEMEIILDEKRAVKMALEEMKEGDILVIFYEKDREELEKLIREKIKEQKSCHVLASSD